MSKVVQPTLIVGLGGTGTLALSEIKKLANQYYIDPNAEFPLLQFLAIDTEFITAPSPETIKKKYEKDVSGGSDADSSYEETHRISLQPTELLSIEASPTNLQRWLKHPDELAAEDFVDPQYMDRVVEGVKGNGAGGFGIVGKLALWQHLESVKLQLDDILKGLNNVGTITEKLHSAYNGQYELDSESNQFNIFVICSVGGGTGRGTFLPIGIMLRELLLKMDRTILERSQRYLINYLPSCFTVGGRNVGQNYITTIQSNQYAAHKELEYSFKRGYPVEKKLRNTLAIGDPNYKINDVYTDVLNISAQKDPTGQYVGDYATINRAVAETILGYTFGGLVSNIRAYFVSNKGSFISNTDVRENAAPQAERKRVYGRIGRYRLSLPIEQLFRYANAYYCREIFDDMLRGHLWTGDEAKPAARADDLSSAFIADAGKVLSAQGFFNLAEVQASCENFDDPWAARIQEAATGRANSLRWHFTKGADGEEPHSNAEAALVSRHLQGPSSDPESGIIPTMRAYVRNYGLRLTRDLAREFIDDCELHLRTLLKEYVSVYNQKRRERTRSAVDEDLSFQKNARGILNVIESARSARADEYNEYAAGAGAHFDSMTQELNREASEWSVTNDTLLRNLGITEKTSKKASSTSIQAVDDTIKAARKAFDRLFEASQRLTTLAAHIRMFDELDKLVKHLDANIETLQNKPTPEKGASGLIEVYKEKAKAIVAERRDALETRVLGNTESEFAAFAREIRFANGELVTDRVQTGLNDNFMERLVTEAVTRESIERVVAEQVSRIDGLAKDYSISSYLKKLSDPEIDKILYGLVSNASLLGKLDPSKVVGGSTKIGLQKTLVQTGDPQLIERHRSVWRGEPVDVVPYSGRESIILTSFETALPQFAFSELYACQTRFFQSAAGDDGRVKAERHTSRDFVAWEEPFGNATRIPAEDLGSLVNFFLHLGVMSLDSQGIISYPSSEFHVDGGAMLPFVDDRRNIKGVPAADLALHIDPFLTEINDHATWFTHFAELARKRLRVVFISDAEKSREYLRRYFERKEGEKGFPYIPEALMSYITHAADDSKPHQGLVRFAGEFAASNEYKKGIVKKQEPQQTRLCRTSQQLAEVFDAPDLSHFDRPSSSPVGEARPAVVKTVPAGAEPGCRSCGNAVDAQAKFCPSCGTPDPLPKAPKSTTCRTCNKPVQEAAKFCPFCGASDPTSGAISVCGSCRTALEPDWAVCPQCGVTVKRPPQTS